MKRASKKALELINLAFEIAEQKAIELDESGEFDKEYERELERIQRMKQFFTDEEMQQRLALDLTQAKFEQRGAVTVFDALVDVILSHVGK